MVGMELSALPFMISKGLPTGRPASGTQKGEQQRNARYTLRMASYIVAETALSP